MEERLIETKAVIEDIDETSLRPRKLDEYIGQRKVKENMSVFYRGGQEAGRPRPQDGLRSGQDYGAGTRLRNLVSASV